MANLLLYWWRNSDSTQGDTCRNVIGSQEKNATCRGRIGRMELARQNGEMLADIGVPLRQVAHEQWAILWHWPAVGPTRTELWTRGDAFVDGTRLLRNGRVGDAQEGEWGTCESWTVGPTRMIHLAGSASGLIGSALSLMTWLRMVENMAFMAYFCVAFYTAFYL